MTISDLFFKYLIELIMYSENSCDDDSLINISYIT